MGTQAEKIKRVRVLVNPKSGVKWSFRAVQTAFSRHWESEGVDVTYQFSGSAEDGWKKARRAVEDGIDVLLVVGGDGTFNTVASALVNTEVAVAAIPTGSGNGFARHFGLPMVPENAVRALAHAETLCIDVGKVNDRKFFVTCGMAWDAALVRSFENLRLRGIAPYFFAGAYELWDYKPQPVRVQIDSGEEFEVPDPFVFTIANLTQYGGGARIAPHARADDGQLELVIARQKDAPWLLANMMRLFDGTILELPQVLFRRFRRLKVLRGTEAPIQIDGELRDAPRELIVEVLPQALKVLVPIPTRAGRAPVFERRPAESPIVPASQP